MQREGVLIVLIVGMATPSTEAQIIRRYHVDAVLVPGLPARDYDYLHESAHARAVSAPAIPLGLPAVVGEPAVRALPPIAFETYPPKLPPAVAAAVGVPGDPVPAKLFQFVATPTLQVGHCVLSNPAVTLTAQGDYVVSFRAIQNPAFANERFDPDVLPGAVIVDDIEPVVRQTSQLLRNRFHVRVLGYASPSPTSPAAVPPAAMEVILPPFWVERGQPLPVRYAGRLALEQARYFELIDRVEIEFFFELQPGLGPSVP